MQLFPSCATKLVAGTWPHSAPPPPPWWGPPEHHQPCCCCGRHLCVMGNLLLCSPLAHSQTHTAGGPEHSTLLASYGAGLSASLLPSTFGGAGGGAASCPPAPGSAQPSNSTDQLWLHKQGFFATMGTIPAKNGQHQECREVITFFVCKPNQCVVTRSAAL